MDEPQYGTSPVAYCLKQSFHIFWTVFFSKSSHPVILIRLKWKTELEIFVSRGSHKLMEPMNLIVRAKFT